MTSNAHIPGDTYSAGGAISRTARQISPWLSVLAAGLAAAGIATGFIRYLHRSPVREAHVPGTSAWVPHLILAAVACALYGVARHRHGRRPGRDSGRLLLAPLGRRAAGRVAATMRRVSWRSAAALPLLVLIGYSCWRIGEQVTGGLDPNFTVNAWGGPSYLGAMACHYLDAGLMIAVSAWLLDKTLLPAAAAPTISTRESVSPSGRPRSRSGSLCGENTDGGRAGRAADGLLPVRGQGSPARPQPRRGVARPSSSGTPTSWAAALLARRRACTSGSVSPQPRQ